MRLCHFVLGLFTLHVSAAPFRYQSNLLPNSTALNNNTSPAPSSRLVKVERLLEDLTDTTLSLLFGMTTATVGYGICGLALPPHHWEACTDFAVLTGSVVGLGHLASQKFPEILESLNAYTTVQRPWEDMNGIVWGGDFPDEKTEIRPRGEED